jgi:hypothetical protein
VNRKSLFTVLALSAVFLATPLVSAVPWTYPKNNEKFQAYQAVGTFSILDIVSGNHKYIPSFEKVNKLIISFDEPHQTHEITVGGNTYQLGTDFLMTDCLTIAVFYDPVFDDPAKLYPTMPDGYRFEHNLVYWTIDFSAIPGGIEGELRMKLVATGEENRLINSLSGTGDLQNVQIKATASLSFTPPFTLNALHIGTVSGWPE